MKSFHAHWLYTLLNNLTNGAKSVKQAMASGIKVFYKLVKA